MIVGFVVVAVEGIGDITATEEASQLATTGTAHSRRIQGGILADGAPLVTCSLRGLWSTSPDKSRQGPCKAEFSYCIHNAVAYVLRPGFSSSSCPHLGQGGQVVFSAFNEIQHVLYGSLGGGVLRLNCS
jgi:hypothetical protein